MPSGNGLRQGTTSRRNEYLDTTVVDGAFRGGHSWNRECLHRDGGLAREAEGQAHKEAPGKEGLGALGGASDDADTNAVMRNSKRLWSTSSGLGDSNARYVS